MQGNGKPLESDLKSDHEINMYPRCKTASDNQPQCHD